MSLYEFNVVTQLSWCQRVLEYFTDIVRVLISTIMSDIFGFRGLGGSG